MDKSIGTVALKDFGEVQVYRTGYAAHEGSIAIQMRMPDGEPVGTLSVFLEGETEKLPPNQFYVKQWSENRRIVLEMAECGLFNVINKDAITLQNDCVAALWELKIGLEDATV